MLSTLSCCYKSYSMESILYKELPKTQGKDYLLKQLLLKTNLNNGQLQLVAGENITSGCVIGLFYPISVFEYIYEDVPDCENILEKQFNLWALYSKWAFTLLQNGYPEFMEYMFPRTETFQFQPAIDFLIEWGREKCGLDPKSTTFQTFCGLFLKLVYNHLPQYRLNGSLTIYKTPSFIDHACFSNCDMLLSKMDGSIFLRAMTNIEKGDVISVSYMTHNPIFWSDDRQAILRLGFGFTCNCALCSGEEGFALQLYKRFKESKNCYCCGKSTKNRCKSCNHVPLCDTDCSSLCKLQHDIMCSQFNHFRIKELEIINKLKKLSS